MTHQQKVLLNSRRRRNSSKPIHTHTHEISFHFIMPPLSRSYMSFIKQKTRQTMEMEKEAAKKDLKCNINSKIIPIYFISSKTSIMAIVSALSFISLFSHWNMCVPMCPKKWCFVTHCVCIRYCVQQCAYK